MRGRRKNRKYRRRRKPPSTRKRGAAEDRNTNNHAARKVYDSQPGGAIALLERGRSVCRSRAPKYGNRRPRQQPQSAAERRWKRKQQASYIPLSAVLNTESGEPTPLEHVTENFERHILLQCGFLRQNFSDSLVPPLVQRLINAYAVTLSHKSLDCITGAHLIASIIHNHLSDTANQCPYLSKSENESLVTAILSQIRIRGGALRDSFLMQPINDIDITVNIHELRVLFSKHMQTFHAKTIAQDRQECACALLQHHLNRERGYFTMASYSGEINLHPVVMESSSRGMPEDRHVLNASQLRKCLAMQNHEWRIVESYHALNTNFFVSILCKAFDKCKDSENRDPISGQRPRVPPQLLDSVQVSRHDSGWLLCLTEHEYLGRTLKRVLFDICDQSGNSYARYQTYRDFETVPGVKDIDALVAAMETILEFTEDEHELYVEQYYFDWDAHIIYYDFTVNAMHIDLNAVLMGCRVNNKGICTDAQEIDFDWAAKVCKASFDNPRVVEYNQRAIRDLEAKVLRAPCLSVINASTANFYFWRLVKTAQKLMYKLENKVWTIDEAYLKCTIRHYPLWFNEDYFYDRPKFKATFINKLLKWKVDSPADIVNRFNVLRYIQFEEHLKDALETHDIVRILLMHLVSQEVLQRRKVFACCFEKFGYRTLRVEMSPSAPPANYESTSSYDLD